MSEAAVTAPPREARPHGPSPAELDAHQEMLKRLTDPIWSDR